MTVELKKNQLNAEAKIMTGPQAMMRVLSLFSILADKTDGMTLSELAESLPAPKSTLRNSLLPLLAEGFLVSQDGRFRLGPRAHALAAKIMSGWSPQANLRYFIEELARRTGETAAIARLDIDASVSVFMDVFEGAHGIRHVMQQGSRAPLNASASGKALLAFAPREFQEEYLKGGKFAAMTPKTIIDANSLRAELGKIRKEGCAVSMEEVVPDGGAIAAPVFGPNGQLICALTISGPISRIEPNLRKLKSDVKEVARAASGQARD